MPHTLTDVASQGTVLKINLAGTFTLVGNSVQLDGPDPTLAIRPVTTLASTSIQKKPGIPDLGKFSGKLLFDPNDTTHITMRARVTSPPTTLDEFQLIYPDGNTTAAQDQFKGILTKFKTTGIEVGGTLQAEFEIDLTDSLVSTPGATP